MDEIVATYSIVACDLDAEQWGVAVQSKFLAVGSVVPWAEPHVGAVATQAYANPRYGPQGLELLRDGVSAADVGLRRRSSRRRPRATDRGAAAHLPPPRRDLRQDAARRVARRRRGPGRRAARATGEARL